jgi:mRNA-degrading endonuclease RelE of RelBE toxin-antitoxin system
MSYNIIPTDKFKKEAKRLAKKYLSLKQDLTDLNILLTQNPTTGTALGNNIYKIRLAIKSKGKGKSGGARVITYVVTNDKEVYLLMIYDKSEIEVVDDKTLKKIVGDIKKEE